MNSKVVFWINDDLSTLGIVNALKMKFHCDVYAIVDITDKTKEFFQHQKIIDFSKIWYIHDHINKITKKPDENYLLQIEKEIGVNFSLLASNERLFNKFNQFYEFTKDEINLIFEQECRLFERVLNEINPEYLIMGVTTLHHNHLFYKICKARGVKVLMVRPSFLTGKYIIADAVNTFQETKIKRDYEFESFQELQEFLKKRDSRKKADKHLSEFQSSRKNFLKSIFYYLFSSNSNVKTHFSYYGRTKFSVFYKTLTYELEKRKRKKFLDKQLLYKNKLDEKFIFFPLHVEPERSINIAAPSFSNQIEIIEKISNSLPDGYKLYVKEHPVMVVRGWRSISNYKKIMSLSNVRLIHPSFRTEDFIKKSSLVIQIGGTPALEAAFYNKPSIVFADLDYAGISSVYKISSFSELPTAIRNMLNVKVKISEINEYINLVNTNSFEFNLVRLSQEFDRIFRLNGFLMDTKISISKMKKFLDDNQDEFNKFAYNITRNMR
tara:strand:+ start:2305 stop:3786 length:1482 start_codon:yes stop_codon:yes gene_type:complete